MFRATHLHNSLPSYIPLISLVSPFTCLTSGTIYHTQKRSEVNGFRSHLASILTASWSSKVIQPEGNNVGILKKVLNKVRFVGHGKARLKIASHYLYESVADRINYLEFFDEFHLPNTFNSWFLVTELHIWMLLLRSMAEGSEKGEDGRFIRNSVVEAMWSDVNTRAKKLGANNPSGTRAQIEVLSEQFQAALITYDEGVMSDDKVFAGALWRRFFEKNCRDYTLLEKLVLYVRINVKMLDLLSREDFVTKPKILWLPLKNLEI